MNKYNLQMIARAFINGDALAIEYHKQLALAATGGQNKIWADIALLECERHLRLW